MKMTEGSRCRDEHPCGARHLHQSSVLSAVLKVEPGQFLTGEADIEGIYRGGQLADSPGADNGERRERLVQHPGQRDINWKDAAVRGNLSRSLDSLPVFSTEPGVSQVAGAKVYFAAYASKNATALT